MASSSEVAREIIKNKLNFELSASDISTAHRLGRKPLNQTSDKRNIVLKLCRRDVKRDLISASFGQRNPTLYVNESLTAPRRKILYCLRQMKKAHPNLISGCSSYEGKIYAKIPNQTSDSN